MGKQENKKTVELSIAKCIEVKYTTSSVLKEKSITKNINYKTESDYDNNQKLSFTQTSVQCRLRIK